MGLENGNRPAGASFVAAALVFLATIGIAPAGSEADRAAAAQRVYRSLARASGEGRRPPVLEVRSESDRARGGDPRRVAWYDPASDKIGIDDKVLQMCAGMPGRRG